MGRIMMLDRDGGLCDEVAGVLAPRGHQVAWRTSVREALALLGAEDFDAVLTELELPGAEGTGLCERFAATRPGLPVVVMAASATLAAAVAAMRAGAYDFLAKPADLDLLCEAIERAARHRPLGDDGRRRDVLPRGRGALLGTSAAILALHELVQRIAPAEASVLVSGETGTGKELVARALHELSPRRAAPFVAVNCAAIPAPLLEAELFGHSRGAFTDARGARRGLLAHARRGTLFLDEVGEMPLAMQAKLLRCLQERTVRPVGHDAEVPFDARIVSATNRDLEALVAEGAFREDLYYRLNVIHVAVPPLRARGGDVVVLARRFLDELAERSGKRVVSLSSAVAERLLAFPWPGNVRELANCMERAVALARFPELVVEDLPERIRNYARSHVVVAAEDPSELVPMAEVERRYVLRVLEAVGGNKTLAADVLGFDRKTLYRKLDRWRTDSGRFAIRAFERPS